MVFKSFSERNTSFFVLSAILLTTLAVFSPLLGFDFVSFDDLPFITENPNIKSGLTVDGIRWAFTTGYNSNWIPLSWLSHMLDVQLFGLKPAGHHFVNLLFHVASTALLFLFLRRTTAALWKSAVVTFLFALHPLHVESVAWVAERKDVLSAFFWMLTMNVYCFYVEKPTFARYCTVVISFALGLLAKPMLVTLPIILLLLDLWPFGRIKAAKTSISRLIGEKIPLLILSGVSSIITFMVQDAAGTVYQSYTIFARASRASVSYLTYLYMMVWPIDLAVIYPFSKYPPTGFKVFLSILVLLSITLLLFLYRKHSPYLLVGWGWYLVTLLPVIGLIQIGQHSVADRYTYIPLIGIFIIVAWGLPLLAKKLHFGVNILVTCSAAISVILIVLTSMQLSYWRNSFTLFDHAVKVTEGNWVAHNNLGLLYQAEGNLDQAINHFKMSINAKPSYPLAHINLGAVYRMKNESRRAIEAFELAVMFEPGNHEARFGLALACLDLGMLELALDQYHKLQSVGSPYAPVLWEELNAKGIDRQ